MAQRIAQRHKCSIDVLACTPIDSRPASIIDLSRNGAKVQLADPFEPGRRIHLDVDGDFYWATVMWSEPDRMGVRFHMPLTDGPLDARLKQLQVQVQVPARSARVQGFGRRMAA